jgi:ABC-type transport system involved in multi-copper enzyme maturation permease subunit
MPIVIALAGIVIKELYRRKDFYVLFVLTALLTLIMGSVNFFNDTRIVRYLKEVCLLLIWISSLVIALVTTARQIPVECEQRTILPLLAKPVSRGQVVLGKFLGCWLACGMALVCFYLFFMVISASREHQWWLASYAQAWWLHWCLLAVVVALVLLGSVVFAAPSSNVTISLLVVVGLLSMGRYLNQLAYQMTEPLRSLLAMGYLVVPHLEFYDVRDLIVHNWGALPWWVCGAATLYAAAYVALFLLLTWWLFRRKALN